jgi:hypothetical protein
MGNLMSFNDLDLNLLRVFDVMMRERSVTRTAHELCCPALLTARAKTP